MSERDDFYRLRDKRTSEYLPGLTVEPRPVYVSVDWSASRSRSGQIAVLALVNQLARVHRVIAVDLPQESFPLVATTGGVEQDFTSAVFSPVMQLIPTATSPSPHLAPFEVSR